ncbi:MAG: hypothetical protein MJZ01_03200 [Bacteroidales bacterium]|nr:hypothetical protein [Bacteroidales bacterium]
MKRNLLKWAVTCFMAVFSFCAANAQFGQMPSPEEMAKMQADQMKETVSLSEEQYAKVLVICKEQSEEMQKLFQEGQPDFSAFGKLQEDQNKKLKEVLTEEQFKKWDEHMQEMRRNMGGF